MLIVMNHFATDGQIEAVVKKIEDFGYMARPIPGGQRVAIGVLYNDGVVDASIFNSMPGVKEVVRITRPYKLVSREFKPDNTIVKVGGMEIGGGDLTIMAGPCSVESEEQALAIGHAVKKFGAHLFRGGAFKPRTSPYSFQGLGEEGLKILAKVREETGLFIVTEAMDTETFDLVEEYSDVVQIGARNMQNFSLLHSAGESQHPVLLKRGMSSTVEELLMAAEYILSHDNRRVILCERGIRTFEDSTRNTTDINAIPVLKEKTHLPVILDPSHATGNWNYVTAVARAGIAAGADGLIIEVHTEPENALSDGFQSLKPERFAELVKQIRSIARAIDRDVAVSKHAAEPNRP